MTIADTLGNTWWYRNTKISFANWSICKKMETTRCFSWLSCRADVDHFDVVERLANNDSDIIKKVKSCLL